MGVRTKARRKISVDGRDYVWYMKDLPKAITPGIVRECIEWAVDGNGAEEIVCNGSTVQV